MRLIKDPESGWIKEILSLEDFQNSLIKLENLIKNSGIKYTNIIAIPRGGLVAGVWLSHHLNIPMIMRTPYLTFGPILIVDDIADTGKTLSKTDPKMHSACLYYKKRSIVKPTYYAEETENWIVFPWELINGEINREI